MFEFLLRILLAGAVGLVIGVLTTNSRNARMFALAAMGAAILTITSTEFYKIIAGPWFTDPGRLSAQIIAALGFIGTGLIWIGDNSQVRGLSVAASLWLTAITGMLIGAGLKNMTVTAVLVVILIYWISDKIIKWKKLDRR